MAGLLGVDRVLRDRALSIDRPPNVPGSLDDEFNGSSLNTSRWTWLDQGTASAKVAYGRLHLLLNENSNRMRGIYQSTPSGTWKVQAKVHMPIMADGDQGLHLFAAQSTSGDVRSMAWWSRDIRGISFSSPSSSALGWGLATNADSPTAYFQIEWDGTDVIASASHNGVEWTELSSQTTAYTPAIVGIGITNAVNSFAVYQVSWFRRVA